MQHFRHALRPDENGNEPSRRVAVISTAMPVSASLQESLSSLERVAVPVNAGLNLRFERPGYDPFPARDLGLVAFAPDSPVEGTGFELSVPGFRRQRGRLHSASGRAILR